MYEAPIVDPLSFSARPAANSCSRLQSSESTEEIQSVCYRLIAPAHFSVFPISRQHIQSTSALRGLCAACLSATSDHRNFGRAPSSFIDAKRCSSLHSHVLGQLQLHRILQPRDLFPPIPRSVIFHQRRPKLVSFYRSRLLVLLTVKPPVQQPFVHPSPSVFFSSNSSSARGLVVSLAHANRPRSSPRFEPAIPIASRPSKPKRKSSPSPLAQEASEAQRSLHIKPSEDKPRNFPQSSFEAHVQLCFSPV